MNSVFTTGYRRPREGVPALAREMINVLARQLGGLDIKLEAIETRLMAWPRQDQKSQLLTTIAGIGPIGDQRPPRRLANPRDALQPFGVSVPSGALARWRLTSKSSSTMRRR